MGSKGVQIEGSMKPIFSYGVAFHETSLLSDVFLVSISWILNTIDVEKHAALSARSIWRFIYQDIAFSVFDVFLLLSMADTTGVLARNSLQIVSLRWEYDEQSCSVVTITASI